MSSWPSTCSCEKLEQLLARLGTTLINLVEGPRESGGGIGGGIGGGMGMGVGVVVGAEQRAALREAWWAAARNLERSIAFGPRRRGRHRLTRVAPGWPGALEEPDS